MRQETTTGLGRGLTALALVALVVSTIAIGPASALGSGGWKFDCKGDASGSVTWTWLLNGSAIAGAGGSATCTKTLTVTGTNEPPAGANGITVNVFVYLGSTQRSNSATKSFDPGTSPTIRLGTSMSDWVCLISEERTCLLWANLHESVHFTLQV